MIPGASSNKPKHFARQAKKKKTEAAFDVFNHSIFCLKMYIFMNYQLVVTCVHFSLKQMLLLETGWKSSY